MVVMLSAETYDSRNLLPNSKLAMGIRERAQLSVRALGPQRVPRLSRGKGGGGEKNKTQRLIRGWRVSASLS